MSVTQTQFEEALTERLTEMGFCRERSNGSVHGVSRKDVGEILSAVGEEITLGLKAEKPSVKSMKEGTAERVVIAVRGLGRWTIGVRPPRASRMGRNPATGEAMKIKAKPASAKLTVKPTPDLKNTLNIK